MPILRSDCNRACREHTRVAAVLVGSALLAAACAPVQRHARNAVLQPESWSESTEIVAAATEQPATLAAWWRSFGDPVLSSLIDEAIVSNPDARTAVARLREVRARAAVARSARAPEVGASAGVGVSQSTGGREGTLAVRYDAGIDAAWEADLFGAIDASVEAAEADAVAAQAAVFAAQVAVAAELARSYIDARHTQQRMALALDSIEALERLLALAELRLAAGVADVQPTLRLRTSIEQARAQLVALESSLALDALAIDVLRGEAPETSRPLLESPSSLGEAPQLLATGVPADLLWRRPDLIAAERRAHAELVRIDIAEAARLPSLRLSGTVGLEALTQLRVGSGAGVGYSLLAGLAVPLFDGGRLRAQVVQQDAAAEQAWIAYEAAVIAALAEVESALAALQAARERGALLEGVRDEADAAASLAAAAYAAGTSDLTTVLDAERNRIAVLESIADCDADALRAVVALYRALGGGWPSGDIENNAEGTPDE